MCAVVDEPQVEIIKGAGRSVTLAKHQRVAVIISGTGEIIYILLGLLVKWHLFDLGVICSD